MWYFLCLGLCKKGHISPTHKRPSKNSISLEIYKVTDKGGIRLCLSLCKKRSHFTDSEENVSKIPNVQKFTQTQTKGYFPF